MTKKLDALLRDIRACRICEEHLPLGPNPVLRASASARILIVGQAPGTKVHATGIPWNDASGERLRAWMDVDRDTFYDESRIAIVPMGFCYPGRGAGGDNPPRPECARTWHPQLIPLLRSVRLTLLIGQYAHRYFLRERRRYWQCSRCRHQCSVISGTIFDSTKLPLSRWFLAMHLLTQSKNNVSALELKRHLGVCYKTAWLMKHKIMQVMREREDGRQLDGRVEIDDAYLGGERRGKRGRGAAGKTPIVAAVETTPERKPRRLRLIVVKGFRKREVEKIAKRDFAPGGTVVSDGLSCWPAGNDPLTASPRRVAICWEERP